MPTIIVLTSSNKYLYLLQLVAAHATAAGDTAEGQAVNRGRIKWADLPTLYRIVK